MNVGDLHRREYGRILATLIRAVGDFEAAEDALQDAFAAAVQQWPVDGAPNDPAAWLFTTARHKALDRLRRRAVAEKRRAELAATAVEWSDEPEPLDPLRLVFTCCHPALSLEAQVALTLRTVCGLTTEEVARAFLVPVPTMAQRIVRAKGKIAAARIPFDVPGDDELSERVDAVLRVVYLVFNEGWAATSGATLVRDELCAEAIRLARVLVALLPQSAACLGLLALMLLLDARRATRLDDDGAIVLLEDQDRTRWNRAQIAEGAALVEQALRASPPSPYAVQAAIAALHARARDVRETDWPQIAALYSVLHHLQPTPVVALNRAVAIAMADGIEQGLALLDEIHLPGYHLLPAARADLLRRLDRREEARAAYEEALSRVSNEAERKFLQRRLRELR